MSPIPDPNLPLFQIPVPAPRRRSIAAALVDAVITAVLWVPRILMGLGLLVLVAAAGWSIWMILGLVLAALGIARLTAVLPRSGHLANVHSRTATVIRDMQGEVIAVIGMEDMLITDPVRGVQRYRANDSIQLVCGAVYNPVMSMGKDPTLLIAVCEECRAPHKRGLEPRHGLCSRSAGSSCAMCAQFLCPRDALKDSDGQVRCYRCSRKHRIKTSFMSLFFRQEEE